jgi:hypothetical protein
MFVTGTMLLKIVTAQSVWTSNEHEEKVTPDELLIIKLVGSCFVKSFLKNVDLANLRNSWINEIENAPGWFSTISALVMVPLEAEIQSPPVSF